MTLHRLSLIGARRPPLAGAAVLVVAVCVVLPVQGESPDRSVAPSVEEGIRPAHSGWGAGVGRPELDGWIEAALTVAPALEAQRAAVRAGAADVDVARARRGPGARIDVTGRQGREKTDASNWHETDVSPWKGAAEIAWNLDPFGRLRAELGAAESGRDAARYALEDLDLEWSAAVADQYVEGWFWLAALRLREDLLAARKAIRAYGARRASAGLLPASELDVLDAAAWAAESGLEDARTAFAAAEVRWSYLTPTNLVPPLASLAADDRGPQALAPVPSRPPPSRDLPVLAAARPDVLAAYSAWLRADHSAAAASRARRPSISAVAAAEGDGPSPVEEPEAWSAWAGVRLSLPLWEPERGAVAVREGAVRDRFAALYRDIAAAALREVRDAYVRDVHAFTAWQSAGLEAAASQRRADSTRRRHEAGLTDFAVSETARLDALTARERLLHRANEAFKSRIRLLRAVGGPHPSRLQPSGSLR